MWSPAATNAKSARASKASTVGRNERSLFVLGCNFIASPFVNDRSRVRCSYKTKIKGERSRDSRLANPEKPPAEPFKRAVAGCVRAIAGQAELDVAFAAEKPAMTPGRVRLPEPPRRMTKQDAAILRGHADSMARREPHRSA